MVRCFFNAVGVALLLLLVAGCEILGSTDSTVIVERTFPDVLDYPEIGLEEIESDHTLPGNYNIKAYVTGISECPYASKQCTLPNGISIAAKRSANYMDDHWQFIPVQHPRQFVISVYYTLSVSLMEEVRTDGQRFRRLRLIGFSI